MKKMLLAFILAALLGAGFSGQAGELRREIPRPPASHPGNVFVAGEPVSIAAPL